MSIQYHGQNLEDKFVHEYFGDYKGTLFDIGANSGDFLSNSKVFIDMGWQAHLFEPGSVFTELLGLHGENDNVRLNNFGISDKSETLKFWESENHIPHGTDTGLVSTTVFEETKRWPNVVFHETEILLSSFNDYHEWIGKPIIDYISLDVEGMEFQILKAIDLTTIGCKALVIEWNGNLDMYNKFINYCSLHSLKLAHSNSENLIFFK